MSEPATSRVGRAMFQAAAGNRRVQPLMRVEFGGRSIGFEYGMLLLEGSGCLGGVDWHVVLLRVPPDDMLAVRSAAGSEVVVAAQTADGEALTGRARLLPFRAAADCLRLIGTSSLQAVA